VIPQNIFYAIKLSDQSSIPNIAVLKLQLLLLRFATTTWAKNPSLFSIGIIGMLAANTILVIETELLQIDIKQCIYSDKKKYQWDDLF
jgi:hypothetical protein